jgi:hypothetical protein
LAGLQPSGFALGAQPGENLVAGHEFDLAAFNFTAWISKRLIASIASARKEVWSQFCVVETTYLDEKGR